MFIKYVKVDIFDEEYLIMWIMHINQRFETANDITKTKI